MAGAIHVTLAAHPDNPARFRHRIDVALARAGNGDLTLGYAIHGLTLDLRLPAPHSPAPADALWRTTCCELFVAGDAQAGYREFNFSPSGQWAAMDFSDYRQRQTEVSLAAPRLMSQHAADLLQLEAVLPAAALPRGSMLRLGVAVVLEALDGHLGYWALRHAPGRPDFHHPHAFALTLGARGFGASAPDFSSVGR